MKRILLLLTLFGSLSASAQFPSKDSLQRYINRWIRNNAVDAFTNLRLNTALNGLLTEIRAVGVTNSGVSGLTIIGDSLKLSTTAGDTFAVYLPTGTTGATNLSVSRTATQVNVQSSTGTTGILPPASQSFAGVMVATDKIALDSATSRALLRDSVGQRLRSIYRRGDSVFYVTSGAEQFAFLASASVGSGTVTQVNSGYGLSGGPITSTGTLVVDSSALSLKYLRRADSLTAYTSRYRLDTANAALRTLIAGKLSNITGLVGVGSGLSIVGTGTPGDPYLLSNASSGGTVTQVNTGYGLSGGPITNVGTVLVDSSVLSAKYLRRADTANLVATQYDISLKQDLLGFTPENVANKSTNTALGSSNTLYPTQNAVKTYVDNGLAAKQDLLGYTPENVANKSTNTALGTSNILYPTQNAVKVYVDNGLATKQNTISLTTVGSSGAATFDGTTLNIPQYAGTTYTAGYGLTLASNQFRVDTATIFAPYQNAINARVKYSDTASMLLPYANKINTKLNNVTNYLTPGTNVNFTGTGTLADPYVINATPGGGGSGTVNSGLANTLAYYASNGTTIDDLPAITANRALVSNANGLPIASAVTSTELGYVSGVTSGIQTQLNGKQPTITTGSTAQYFRGDLSLATFPTNVSTFTNDAGYITASSTNTLTNKTISGANNTLSNINLTSLIQDGATTGQVIKWNGTSWAPGTDNTSGGGGGSGTVNSGLANRLAYYAADGTTVDALAAITANRVIVSNSNGLPVAASTTTTQLGYLDATSSIQTQLNAKLENITGKISAGSGISISGLGTTASPYVINNSSPGATYFGGIYTSINGENEINVDTSALSGAYIRRGNLVAGANMTITAVGNQYVFASSGGSSSLTSTRVGFGSGSNTLTDDADYTYDATNNRLQIGGSSYYSGNLALTATQPSIRLGQSGTLKFTAGVSDATNALVNTSLAGEPVFRSEQTKFLFGDNQNGNNFKIGWVQPGDPSAAVAQGAVVFETNINTTAIGHTSEAFLFQNKDAGNSGRIGWLNNHGDLVGLMGGNNADSNFSILANKPSKYFILGWHPEAGQHSPLIRMLPDGTVTGWNYNTSVALTNPWRFDQANNRFMFGDSSSVGNYTAQIHGNGQLDLRSTDPQFHIDKSDLSQPFTFSGGVAATKAARMLAAGNDGGLALQGFTNGDNTAFFLQGHVGTTTPTQTAIQLTGYKSSGSSRIGMSGSAEKVLTVSGATDAFTVFGDEGIKLGTTKFATSGIAEMLTVTDGVIGHATVPTGGGLSGGVSGQGTYWTGSTSVAPTSALQIATVSGSHSVGIGAAPGNYDPAGDPGHMIQIINDNGTKQMLSMISVGPSVYQNNIHPSRYDGTLASPTNTKNGMYFLSIGGRGHNGTALTQSTAALQIQAVGDYSGSNLGSQFIFQTTPTGTTTRADAMVLGDRGDLFLGSKPASAWGSPFKVIESNNTGIRFATNAANVELYQNLRFNGGWVRPQTGESSFLLLDEGGALNFYGAASGSAGGTPTLNERFYVGNTGGVRINNAYTLPTSAGSANQVLAMPASGSQLVWTTPSGGGGSQSWQDVTTIGATTNNNISTLNAATFSMYGSTSYNQPFTFGGAAGFEDLAMRFLPTSGAGGVLQGFSAAAGEPGFLIQGHTGSNSPTAPAIQLQGYRSDGGTSRTAFASNQVVMSVINGTTDRFAIFGGGGVLINTGNQANGYVLTYNSSNGYADWAPASGGGSSYTGSNSILLSGSNFTLVNDNASPGNSYYYGTNSGGTKGFHPLPGGGQDASFTTLSQVTTNGTTTNVSGSATVSNGEAGQFEITVYAINSASNSSYHHKVIIPYIATSSTTISFGTEVSQIAPEAIGSALSSLDGVDSWDYGYNGSGDLIISVTGVGGQSIQWRIEIKKYVVVWSS